MDADATLREILALIHDNGHGAFTMSDEDSAHLCDLIETLNVYLVDGGFLPSAWARAR